MSNHPSQNPLFSSVRQLIEESKQHVAATVATLWRQLSWTQSSIKVAEYLTLFPSQELLKEKLHKAIAIASSKNREND